MIDNFSSRPVDLKSGITLDDILKLISDFDTSTDDFLKLFSDAVRRAYRVYNVLPNRHDMEDIAQSIVMLLIKNDCRILRSFESRSSLETWLQVIANREVVRFHRRQKDMISLEDLAPGDQVYTPNHDDKVLHDEIIHKLTRGQRKLLDLIIHGLNTAEIAERIGIEPDSVSRNKHRLRNKVSKLLRYRGRRNETTIS
jgi:RNA polymerase sigma factor (sigma-70 family)